MMLDSNFESWFLDKVQFSIHFSSDESTEGDLDRIKFTLLDIEDTFKEIEVLSVSIIQPLWHKIMLSKAEKSSSR